MAVLKTYELLPSENISDSPFSFAPLGPDDQPIGEGLKMNVREKEPMVYRQLIQQVDKDGAIITREIRYMRRARSPWVDEQVKAGIDAKENPSPEEVADLEFNGGLLTASRQITIDYLEASANSDKFPADLRLPGQRARYRAVDQKQRNRDEIKEFQDRARAANAILKLNLEQATDILRERYPTNDFKDVELIDAQLMLRNILNEEDGGDKWLYPRLNKRSKLNKEGEVTVLVNKAIQKGVLSTSDLPGYVALAVVPGNYEPLVALADEGDANAQIKKLVSWLTITEEGRNATEIIQGLVDSDDEDE